MENGIKPPHPGSENLRPFGPGQCGNPNGRPKGTYSLTAILRKVLTREIDFNDPITQQKVKKTLGDVVILQLVAAAIKGDTTAAREIVDRIDGVKNKLNINMVAGNQTNETNINLNLSQEEGDKLDAAIIDIIGTKIPRELGHMDVGVPENQGEAI